LHLDWTAIHKVFSVADLQAILDRHAGVFKDKLGTLQGVKMKLHVDSAAQLKSCKPRQVPFSLRQKVETELQHLQDESVIEPVQLHIGQHPLCQ